MCHTHVNDGMLATRILEDVLRKCVRLCAMYREYARSESMKITWQIIYMTCG